MALFQHATKTKRAWRFTEICMIPVSSLGSGENSGALWTKKYLKPVHRILKVLHMSFGLSRCIVQLLPAAVLDLHQTGRWRQQNRCSIVVMCMSPVWLAMAMAKQHALRDILTIRCWACSTQSILSSWKVIHTGVSERCLGAIDTGILVL